MLPKRFADVLKQIASRLSGTNIIWAVTGSAGFALQGVPVEPNDIDLQTDEEGAYALSARFADHVVEHVQYRASERIRSHFGRLELGGIQAEIMGDLQKMLPDGSWEAPVDVSRHRHFVVLDGQQIPVLSLEYERDAYRLMGRHDRAELLGRWLHK